MTFTQLLVAFGIIYFCAYAVINRICRCIEHCATARAFSKFQENGGTMSSDECEEVVTNEQIVR